MEWLSPRIISLLQLVAMYYAKVASAAAIAVCYPHMNGLGGDSFWLIHSKGKAPVGIDACGAAAGLTNIDFYRDQGLKAIPTRGPLASLTMAGAVSGWQKAFDYSKNIWGERIPLARLLEPAIEYARQGVRVTHTLANNASVKLPELRNQPGFSNRYLIDGQPVKYGDLLKQPELAGTFESLVHSGLKDSHKPRR